MLRTTVRYIFWTAVVVLTMLGAEALGKLVTW